MTSSAIRWETSCYVIWIACLVVITCMTSIAGVGRCVVIAIVASSTIIGNAGMRPVQLVIIIVYRERRGSPARRRGMTHRAIHRDTQCVVVRIGSCVKICAVATRTIGWRVVVIAVVAGIAVVCNLHMRAGKRPNSIVVKCRWRPCSL